MSKVDAKSEPVAYVRPPHTCRYCGLDVHIAGRALAQENPTKARAEHSNECEWIGMVLPVVAPCVSDVIYGASWGTDYDVLTYDSDSDEMRVSSSHTTLRESKRAARRLARSLGVPCRQSGRAPEVWVPKLRRWVPC